MHFGGSDHFRERRKIVRDDDRRRFLTEKAVDFFIPEHGFTLRKIKIFRLAYDLHTGTLENIKKTGQRQSRAIHFRIGDLNVFGVVGHGERRERKLTDELGQSNAVTFLHKTPPWAAVPPFKRFFYNPFQYTINFSKKEELFAFFRERKSENAGIHSLFIFLSYTIKNCPEGSLIPLHGIDFPSEKEKSYEARKNIHAGCGIFAFRVVALFFFFLFCFRSASRLSPRR